MNISPSKNTSPSLTANKRDNAFSKVDFPQPLGPMIDVTLPSGISTSNLFIIVLSRNQF